MFEQFRTGKRKAWEHKTSCSVVPTTRLSLLSLILLSGCGGLAAVNMITPNANTVARDINFSQEHNLRLDVYAPDDEGMVGQQARPVVVFLHGGAWQDGNREQYAFVASGLTREGYVAVIPDMRQYPEASFPAFVNDAAAAVQWTFANVRQFGGDPSRVFLLGHSSGAHIGSLLNYDQRYLTAALPFRICGFIGLSGPYDFLPLVSPTLKNIFPQALRNDSQPGNFVDGDEPPALLLHGLQDNTAKPRNSAALAQIVKHAGGQAELGIYEDKRHAPLVLALSSTLDYLAPVLTDVSGFIQAQSCHPASSKTSFDEFAHRRL